MADSSLVRMLGLSRTHRRNRWVGVVGICHGDAKGLRNKIMKEITNVDIERNRESSVDTSFDVKPKYRGCDRVNNETWVFSLCCHD